MKKKHYTYACYMATLSSLPLLYKVYDRSEILEAILAKTSIGVSTKLLDNLNDSFHTVDRAILTLEEFRMAMARPNYLLPSHPGYMPRMPGIAQAENSSFLIGSWVPRILRRCQPSVMYKVYVRDVEYLIDGQIDSIRHKAGGDQSARSVREYLASISEKSIGDVWLDVDLCFLERGLGHFDRETWETISRLKSGYGMIFKSTLVYDDAQDLLVDLEEGSINIAVLLGLEEGVITPGHLLSNSPGEIVDRLEAEGVVSDTVHLADMMFLKGVREVVEASAYLTGTIDWGALIRSFRFVRLFNLRKMLARKKDVQSLKLFMSSLRDFEDLESAIPDHVRRLEPFLHPQVVDRSYPIYHAKLPA